MNFTQMTLQGGALILAIFGLRCFALNKLPKWTFTLLWDIALLRLFFPFEIASTLSIFRFSKPSVSSVVLDVVSTPGETVPSAVVSEHTASMLTLNVSMAHVLWLAGALIFALVFLCSYLRSRNQLRFATKIRENSLVDGCLSQLRPHRTIAMLETDRITTPVSYGLLRPRIILPLGTDRADPELLRHILLHECIHIRRFDPLRKLLLLAAVCIHWFNPTVWLMLALANRDMELSCDELVLRKLGMAKRKDYALSLLRMSEQRSPVFFVYCTFSKNPTKERVTSIMKAKKHSVWITILALVLVFGLTTAFTTSASADSGPYDLNNASDMSSVLRSTIYDWCGPNQGPNHADGQVDSGEDLGLLTWNGDLVCVYNDGGSWNFQEGQTINVEVSVPNANVNAVNVGYIVVDDEGNIEPVVLLSEQIIKCKYLQFTAPESGSYYFFFGNFSSEQLVLDGFQVY